MNVLSLFDGMSCGRVALERAGVKVDNYFASEIDRYAIQVSKNNWGDIIQLGDVLDWRSWDIDWVNIDLLVGGFPCQSFSFAGSGKGFDDERGKLAITTMDILSHAKEKNPNLLFLFENVRMKKQHSDQLNEMFGVDFIEINSALVSAQNRVRYYWSNIQNVERPVDRGVYLEHILEPDLPSCGIGARIVGRRLNELGKREDYNNDIPIIQYLELRTDRKSNCLTTVYKDSVVPYFKTDKRLKIKFNQKKASCLTGGAHSGGNHSDMDILVIDPNVCRRYSVKECERLQTLPDGYTEGVSNSQRYKMLGNGWTVDVIAHILKSL